VLGKYIDTSKVTKHPDSSFDWDKFYQYVIGVYGSIESPSYSFARIFCENKKYPEVDEFLGANYEFVEDTEPNTDVSYGYLIKGGGGREIFRVSLVGPYFYLSSISAGGGQNEPNADFEVGDFRSPLLDFMGGHGFVFTPKDVLKKRIVFGGEFVSVYSVIYCYEDEPLWVAV